MPNKGQVKIFFLISQQTKSLDGKFTIVPSYIAVWKSYLSVSAFFLLLGSNLQHFHLWWPFTVWP